MKTKVRTFEITPQGEYSLEEGANFIGAWHRAPSDTGDPEGHLHLAFLTDGDWIPVGVCLRQDARGDIHGTVYGDAEAEAVETQVARILSLEEVAQADARLRSRKERHDRDSARH